MINQIEIKEEVLKRVNDRMVRKAHQNHGVERLNEEDKSRHVNSLIKVGAYDCGSPIYISIWDEIPIEEIYNNSLNSNTIGELNVFRCRSHIFYSICCPKTDFVDKFKQLASSVDKILSDHGNLKTTSQLDIVEVSIDEDSTPWIISIIAIYDPEMYLKVLVEEAYGEGVASHYFENGKPVWEVLSDE